MKERKRVINDNKSLSGSASPSLSRREFFLLGAAVVAYWFFVKTMNITIDYPMILVYVVGALVFVAVFVYGMKAFIRKLLRIHSLISRMSEVFLGVIKSAVCSLFATGVILIPFNYYNIYVAKKKPAIVVHLPITGIVANSRSHKIYYDFNGKMGLLNGRDDLMNEIYDKGNYKDYRLVMTIHTALLGSYFIEDWYIEKK